MGVGLYLGETAMPWRYDLLNAHSRVPVPALDMFVRWDADYYYDLIFHGYWYGPGLRSSVAFFPLYPILVIATSWTGLDPFVSGLVVSNAALLGALIALHRLTEAELGPEAARRTTVYLATFPTALFLGGLYTESLFLLIAVGAMTAARARAWTVAASLGILAGVTRAVGCAVWAGVAVQWLVVQDWKLPGDPRADSAVVRLARFAWDKRSALVLLAMPLGLASYMLYLYGAFGDPMVFVRTQTTWDRGSAGPLPVLRHGFSSVLGTPFVTAGLNPIVVADLVIAVIGLAMCLRVWRKLGPAYAAYAAAALLVPLSTGTMSMLRFTIVAFPLFMVLGEDARHPVVDRLLACAFAVFLGVFSIMFPSWYFVG